MDIVIALDALSRSMGHGVLGAELCCEKCHEYIDLDYIYHEHAWRGVCYQCSLFYVVDLERIISKARYALYNDWDRELKGLLES